MYLGGLCFITDRHAGQLSHEGMSEKVLSAGVKWIQHRAKNISRNEIYTESVALRKLTHTYGALLVVNDYPDIAAAADADGVHLGQDDLPVKETRKVVGPEAIIGVSAHSVGEAVKAEQAGADYVGVGPVFHTPTKDAGSPKGVELIRSVKDSIYIPVVAIGGIHTVNLRPVLDAGADAVAVASGILQGDIGRNAEEMLEILASYDGTA
jgi:thiamine-phosphate pyrophosphorylase